MFQIWKAKWNREKKKQEKKLLPANNTQTHFLTKIIANTLRNCSAKMLSQCCYNCPCTVVLHFHLKALPLELQHTSFHFSASLNGDHW